MNILFLIGSRAHPISNFANSWISSCTSNSNNFTISYDHTDANEADVVFVLSYPRILPNSFLERHPFVIVLHASDLPLGRGWSPHIWQILHGSQEITISALSAAQEVDSGHIWAKKIVHIPSTSLHNEINQLIFSVEFDLIEIVLDMIGNGDRPVPQD